MTEVPGSVKEQVKMSESEVLAASYGSFFPREMSTDPKEERFVTISGEFQPEEGTGGSGRIMLFLGSCLHLLAPPIRED